MRTISDTTGHTLRSYHAHISLVQTLSATLVRWQNPDMWPARYEDMQAASNAGNRAATSSQDCDWKEIS